jgi:Flp pilus assembly protein TadD
VDGHYNLALALYRRGDLGGAEKSMRRALLLSSENAMIHLALGAMLVQREETRAEGSRN